MGVDGSGNILQEDACFLAAALANQCAFLGILPHVARFRKLWICPELCDRLKYSFALPFAATHDRRRQIIQHNSHRPLEKEERRMAVVAFADDDVAGREIDHSRVIEQNAAQTLAGWKSRLVHVL